MKSQKRTLLHLSLVLSLGVTACKGASNARKLYTPSGCLDAYSFELIFEGECTYEELSLAVADKLASLPLACSSNDVDDEVIALLYATDEDHARSIVDDLCADAIRDQVFSKDPFDFDRFSGHDHEFNKAFFDGQSSWNDGGMTWKKALLNPPTSNGDASDEFHGSSKIVSDIYDMHAMKRQMTWPDQYENFEECNLNVAMCCWVDHDATLDPRFVKNTDICYVDNTRAPSSNHIDAGFSIYGGANGNEDTFCHGFAWEDGSLDDTFKGNLLFISEIYENMHNHGLSNNVPGAPMCGCLEQVSSF
jgi:hypothetical protein